MTPRALDPMLAPPASLWRGFLNALAIEVIAVVLAAAYLGAEFIGAWARWIWSRL